MSLPKFRYAAVFGLMLGLLLPTVLMTCFWLRVFSIAGDWLLFIWPSSIMLMATENIGHSPEAFGILAVSIAYNVILYAILFVVIWCVAWFIRAWRSSLRDGTTI